MVLRSDWSTRPCPIARGINEIGDPWVLLILRELLSGIHRFDEIREHVEAADNVLADRLKKMVANGLAQRIPYRDGGRTRYEYHPTQSAADALPVLHAYSIWAQQNTPSKQPNRRLSIICRECGSQSDTGESCSACTARLTVDNVAWIRPIFIDEPPRPLAPAQ